MHLEDFLQRPSLPNLLWRKIIRNFRRVTSITAARTRLSVESSASTVCLHFSEGISWCMLECMGKRPAAVCQLWVASAVCLRVRGVFSWCRLGMYGCFLWAVSPLRRNLLVSPIYQGRLPLRRNDTAVRGALVCLSSSHVYRQLQTLFRMVWAVLSVSC